LHQFILDSQNSRHLIAYEQSQGILCRNNNPQKQARPFSIFENNRRL